MVKHIRIGPGLYNFKIMNSDIACNENVDLWSLGKCIFCEGNIEEDSKILKCLHIICKNCTKRESTDSGVLCKCKILTKGELIDYSIVLPNQSQVKICCEQNCNVPAKKICMHCKSIYCKPCSKTHSNKNADHNPALMMTYPLKKEFVSCPKCMEKCVEVFCTNCSMMICPLCHLNFHQTHNFELLSSMATKKKATFHKLLTDLRKNDNYLDCLMEKSDENIKKLESKKKTINDKIDERIKMLHEEVDKRGLELKKLLETNITDSLNNINMNKVVINDFKKETEYYHTLTSFVINSNKTFGYIKLSNIIMDQMTIVRRRFRNISKDATPFQAKLVYNDEQSMNKCVESIQRVGDISSTKIINLSKFKVTVNPNKVLQTPENDKSLISSYKPVMIQPGMIKLEKRIDDSDSSDFEPLVSCSCCNQWTEELINCTSCNRSYHNNCHIPPLAKELKPKDPSLKWWKCTLCHDVSIHINTLREKDLKSHISIGPSERKLIERILLELYCQNEDSEHYRDCLDREIYPMYYEKIADPISLNNIKQRLESDGLYTSLIDVIKDMKKVFTNGKLYYSVSDHPFYKSANELQITLEKLITFMLPTLDRAYLE